MKKITTLLLLIAFILNSNAQKNSVRLGLFGLPSGQINLKYERLLNDNMSIGATVGILVPQRLKSIENALQSVSTNEMFLKVSGFSVVPEFRYYTAGNGDLSGFYIAPALEFSNNSLDFFIYNNGNALLFESDIMGLGGSINIGAQWVLGKGFTIDWNILGIGFNNYFTNASVATSSVGGYTLDDSDAETIEKFLKDIPIVGTGVQNVSLGPNNQINMNASNFIPIPRMGLSLGWSF